MTPQRSALIVGAGLAGTLLAIALARDSWRVSLFERRPDPRAARAHAGRSINLAVSARGIHALRFLSLEEKILAAQAVPMRGRLLHAPDSSLSFQPYSAHGDAIQSFSRAGLNVALLHEAAALPGVSLRFEHTCLDADLAAPAAIFRAPDGSTLRAQADMLVATDGAYSAVRAAFLRSDRFEYSQSYLTHAYKELHIPPNASNAGAGGGFAMEPNALHIWPRTSAMMIALPNRDASFTATLFWPWRGGEHSFENLEGPLALRRAADPGAPATPEERERIGAFFTRVYPDAPSLMPTLVDDFCRNPTSSLVTVRCEPWQRFGRAALLGDAAHAVVPFYGQGMNAAFEDVVCLATLLRTRAAIADALDEYARTRKPDADAIADMALDNFVEMRDLAARPDFQHRKRIEQALHRLVGDAVTPQYNLVSFSTVPYSRAQRRGRELDALLRQIAPRIPTRTSPPDTPDPEWDRLVLDAARPLLSTITPIDSPAPHAHAL